jgi:hypothetical protein
MGSSKGKNTAQKDKERDERERRKTWFIRKFYITKTPGNFSLEVRFTCKNVSRNICE